MQNMWKGIHYNFIWLTIFPFVYFCVWCTRRLKHAGMPVCAVWRPEQESGVFLYNCLTALRQVSQ